MALLALGFRPLYLLAGAYAALSVPLWALQFSGRLPGANLLWHAHEMLFGYAFAVIAGFLLTAVRAWTGRPTPTGVRSARSPCSGSPARLAACTRCFFRASSTRRSPWRRRLGNRPADRGERQPQLVLHPARARARRGQRRFPGLPADRARGRAGRRAARHRHHGRARDPGIHQQRGHRRRRAPQPWIEHGALGACC